MGESSFQHEDLSGTVVGLRYRLLERTDAGVLGENYLAERTNDGETVVVKMLHHLREAAAVARLGEIASKLLELNAASVVRAQAVFPQESPACIVVEHVPWATLRETIESEGRIDPWRAWGIAVEVLNALEAGQALGLAHGDVTPDTILVGRGGRVKLADFALATLNEDPKRTKLGPIYTGAPEYKAPERLAERTGPRSDIWSVGACLYEMVTGRRAFPQTGGALMVAVLTMEPDALPADVPLDLADVVRRALEKEPGKRFANAADMRASMLVPA